MPVSLNWGKNNGDSPSSPHESASSARSTTPPIPGAFSSSFQRAERDTRTHRQDNNERGTNSNDPRLNNQHGATTSERAPDFTANTTNSILPTATRKNSNNRYAALEGVDAAFSANLRISARGDNSSNDHPLFQSQYYRANTTNNHAPTDQPALRTRNEGTSRSSDQSRPLPAATMTSTPGSRRKLHLRRMASETLEAINAGSYDAHGKEVSIREALLASVAQSQFYGPDTAALVYWLTAGRPVQSGGNGAIKSRTQVSVLNISTLAGARLLENVYQRVPGAGSGSNPNPTKCFTGVLNFASATKPGGGFQNGAEAQEESLARASTLYASLSGSEQAHKFYRLHTEESRENLLAYYSHAIIYSPKVLVLRDDEDGAWFEQPFAVDILSCAAVNAGEVRRSAGSGSGSRPGRGANAQVEVDIEKEMTERMGRILCVFEKQGVRNLVLGTFGTGVFQNKVDVVARIWAHLLIRPEARFKDVFDRVIFAITGQDTFLEFQSAFAAWGKERAAGHGKTPSQRRGPPSPDDLIDL